MPIASDQAHHSCEKKNQKTKYDETDETGETAANNAKSMLSLLSRTNKKQIQTRKERKTTIYRSAQITSS
jgi:hypothetical protein